MIYFSSKQGQRFGIYNNRETNLESKTKITVTYLYYAVCLYHAMCPQQRDQQASLSEAAV